jgi:hypothetical protein
VRDIYLTGDADQARVFIDKAITGCATDKVPEIQALGRTLAAWRSESWLTIRPGPATASSEH